MGPIDSSRQIMVLDEVASSADLEIDQYLQNTIEESFGDCTILTIAHKIKTLLSCDRIMVIENGTVCDDDDGCGDDDDGGGGGDDDGDDDDDGGGGDAADDDDDDDGDDDGDDDDADRDDSSSQESYSLSW